MKSIVDIYKVLNSVVLEDLHIPVG